MSLLHKITYTYPLFVHPHSTLTKQPKSMMLISFILFKKWRLKKIRVELQGSVCFFPVAPNPCYEFSVVLPSFVCLSYSVLANQSNSRTRNRFECIPLALFISFWLLTTNLLPMTWTGWAVWCRVCHMVAWGCILLWFVRGHCPDCKAFLGQITIRKVPL